MNKELSELIGSVCEQLFGEKFNIELSRPEEQFGDFSCNVAMQLAGRLSNPPAGGPKEIAQQIVEKLRKNTNFSEVNVAGPGFINLKLKDSILFDQSIQAAEHSRPLSAKTVVAEYSDPNPFKALHAGHLYTTLVGDGIANLLEVAGAEVKRVNFGGDVGLHVAKAMWGIVQKLGGENYDELKKIDSTSRARWINECYANGHAAYTSDEKAKLEIEELNNRIYELHKTQEKDSNFAKIYWICRQWSYDGFEKLYDDLHVKPFDKYYPESSVDELGLKTIKEHLGSVYHESEGAIVFKAEEYGLFTQVFINSRGITTYAGKDVGLILTKEQDYHPDISYIITDVSQKDHLSVVLKSIEQYEPELVKKTVHQTHGRIKLPGGKKMSSREGSVVMADDVIEAAKQSAKNDDHDIIVGAIRYSFLRTKVGGDIVYDAKESVSHDGNSGPYLQYALVRAKSIIQKLDRENGEVEVDTLDKFERSLARQLTMFEEAFSESLVEYSLHHICIYLYELAQIFNRFYENNRVADDPRETLRTQLVIAYKDVLEKGLDILGMPKPEKM